MILYHYPKCGTCRTARKWLDEQGVTVELVDLTIDTPDVKALTDLHGRSGLPLKRFFNTSGQSYRGGGFKDRLPSMSSDDQLAALAADGKLIKRPILDTGSTVLVGFKADAWADAVG